MSCYIVNDETITVIAKGFVEYGVGFEADDYKKKIRIIVDQKAEIEEIGQSLLNQNYASVNARYRENTPTPKFEMKQVKFNEGILLGCVNCYEYQSCETDNFYDSKLWYSLERLKDKILRSLIARQGQEIPWGYEDIDE